jgi:hypothetical protein
MGLENATFQWGPLLAPSPDTDNTLVDCDPILDLVLRFSRTIIETYHGSRFSSAVDGYQKIAGNDGYQIVAQAIADDPIEGGVLLTGAQYRFPLLACFRTEETYTSEMLQLSEKQSEIVIIYMLPSLSSGMRRRVLPLRNAIATTLVDRLMRGADPNFENDEPVFSNAGIMVEPLRTVYGAPQAADKLLPMMMMTLRVTETQNENAPEGAFDDLDGVDLDVSVIDGYVGTQVRVDFV